MGRRRSRKGQRREVYRGRNAWLAVTCVAGSGIAVAAIALSPAFAGNGMPRLHGPARPQAAASSGHGIGPKMAACERHSSVCDPAALRSLPLYTPATPGAPLMSRRQVLSRFGLTDASVAVARMTYGQLHAADPALAASSVVNPARIIWVITRYFRKAVTVPYDNGPPGAPTTHKIFAESIVIDAATGDVTDYCQGCAGVPRIPA